MALASRRQGKIAPAPAADPEALTELQYRTQFLSNLSLAGLELYERFLMDLDRLEAEGRLYEQADENRRAAPTPDQT